MTAFNNPTDIANRTCQHCGVQRIAAGALFTEDSKNAGEIASCYHQLREAEMRRNVWRFTVRTAVLRPLDTTTLQLVPATYNATKQYILGSIVNYGGIIYISQTPSNKGNQPDLNPALWSQYFGPMTANFFDPSTTYFAGELVYTPQDATNYKVYLSLSTGNSDVPAVYTAYANPLLPTSRQAISNAAIPYMKGQTVAYNGANWQSNVDLNMVTPNITLTAYNAGTAYVPGNAVLGSDSNSYTNLVASTGVNPVGDTTGHWYLNGVANSTAPAAWAGGTSYSIGNSVTASNNYRYTSVTNSNLGNDPTLDLAGVNWTKGAAVEWIAIPANEPDNRTGNNWLQLDATLASIFFVYPPNSGPVAQPYSRNVYQLPNGYLREAPQDPKAGSNSFLGAPTGRQYDDWEFQDNYIITQESRPIVFRFVASLTNVTSYDPMFCEGLGARIALEVCETLTQSSEKFTAITAKYQKFMGEARAVNGIETAPEEPPLDDYIACRV